MYLTDAKLQNRVHERLVKKVRVVVCTVHLIFDILPEQELNSRVMKRISSLSSLRHRLRGSFTCAASGNQSEYAPYCFGNCMVYVPCQ